MANLDFTDNHSISSTTDDPGVPRVKRWREILVGVAQECQQGFRLLMDTAFIVGQNSE